MLRPYGRQGLADTFVLKRLEDQVLHIKVVFQGSHLPSQIPQGLGQELSLLLPGHPRVENDSLPVVALSHHPVGPEDPRVGAGVGLLLCQQSSRQLVCS